MRVLIVSAFPAIRSGLATLMRGQPGWTVAGELAPDALSARVASAPPATLDESADVVLFDIERPPEVDLDLERHAGGFGRGCGSAQLR